MKSNDEKKDDTSSLTDEERRTTTDSVLKELLQVAPPMAPDGELSETESTKNFVVPDYLIAGVEEMKEIYPDASDETLANILKYS
jgi:hypothetical protein